MAVFPIIDFAFRSCDSLLASMAIADIDATDTERYLVAGLVVLIVSEYEDYLETLFIRRADLSNDRHLSNFVRNAISQRFRSPDLSKINDNLRRFDESCLSSFKNAVENTRQHASWDSILRARHAVVHRQGSLNLTYGELKEKYADTVHILDSAEIALGLAR